MMLFRRRKVAGKYMIFIFHLLQCVTLGLLVNCSTTITDVPMFKLLIRVFTPLLFVSKSNILQWVKAETC